MGEQKRAALWVDEEQLVEIVRSHAPSARFDPVWEIRSQTLARWYMSQADYQAAFEVIEPLLVAANRNQRMRSVIKFLAMQAVLLYMLRNTKNALKTLNQALDLGKDEGFIRTFLDEGQSMVQLLYKAAAEGYHSEYIGRLVKEFASEVPISKRGYEQSDLVEPLSSREIEVLELIAGGKSNQEIAGILHISLSTVKGHTSNLYGKLGVHARTQAVSRGRDLGIINQN